MKQVVALVNALCIGCAIERHPAYVLFGKALGSWVIDAARGAHSVHAVCVFTDSGTVAEALSGTDHDTLRVDRGPVIETARTAVKRLFHERGIRADRVVLLDARVPEIQSSDIDRAVAMLDKHDLTEVISVKPSGVQCRSLRVFQGPTLFRSDLSDRIGIIKSRATEVRDMSAIASIQSTYETRERFITTRE